VFPVTPGWPVAAVLVSALVSASCGSTPVAAPPASPQRAAPAKTAARATSLKHAPADTTFMQGMIGHHAQALEMTALLYSRTTRADMKLLAERIDVSQGDEIKMMKRWLESRGETVPNDHAHHMAGATLMPGMLTADQMARLSAAKGDEFDRLFLEAMIYHHQGAIAMVAELFAAPGAAQDSDIFDFASHVDGDQRMEISRMQAMLKGRR
jgi:uncharacterized protein (DUF305 family)